MAEISQELKELIETSPAVDKKRLMQFAKELQKVYVVGMMKKYKLASPVERRHIVVGENDRSDPRTIQLSPRRK